MAAAVTYEFYSQVYGGGLSESAFGLALPAASRHVRWLVGGREPSEDELEAYRGPRALPLMPLPSSARGKSGALRSGTSR